MCSSVKVSKCHFYADDTILYAVASSQSLASLFLQVLQARIHLALTAKVKLDRLLSYTVLLKMYLTLV